MTRFRHHLSADHPLVADHRVAGTPVLPAAAQLDTLLTACDATRPDCQWRLEQIAFLRPLGVRAPGVEIEAMVDEQGACSLSAWLPDETTGPAEWSAPLRLDGPPEPDPRAGTWTTHSQARATGSALTPPTYLNVAELRAGCAEELPLAQVAAWRGASGIEYGPTFSAIRSVQRGPGRMLALLRAPEEPSASYVVPPPLLDSVFQCLGILDDGAAGPCLPWYVGRLTARRRVSGTVLALVEHLGTPEGGGAVRGRATLCNQQGEILLELDRITLKSTSTPAPAATPPAATPPAETPAPALAPAVPEGAVTVQEWRPLVPEPEAAPAAAGHVATGVTLIVADGDALGTAPGPAAGDRQAVRLTPGELTDERLDSLLNDTNCREVIYLATPGEKAPTEALHRVFALIRRLAKQPPMPRLTLLTRAAQPVAGRGKEDVEPYQSALWGLGRTLRVEHPQAHVRLIDLGTDDAIPPLDELRYTQQELARRDGTWYTPALTPVTTRRNPAPDPAPAARIRGGRFLVTGGMRGIGLHVAEFLARQGCAHLTLVGRTVPADGALRQRLDRLADTCEVELLRADVRALPDALSGAPRVDGVFHAAGVLQDGLARTLPPERIDAVFGPKIGGAHALDEAFPADARPGFVALFSSIAAVHGNLGQSSYATANAYLDGYAARKRAQGEAWYSLNWGLWAVGMGEAVAAGAAARGIPALTAEEGIALLHTALSLPPATYVLSAVPREKDEQMTAVPPEDRLWPSLSAILKETLRVGDLSPDDNLLELGLDSMMAVEVAAALSAEGLDVDPMAIFEQADVRALLAHLDGLPRNGSPAAAQSAPAPSAAAPARPVDPPSAIAPPPVAAPPPPARAADSAPVMSPSPVAERPFTPDWDRFRAEDRAGQGTAPVAAAARVTQPPPAPPLVERPSAPASASLASEPKPMAPTRRPHTPAPDGLIPRRTLPGRLTELPQGTFLDRRIDALSAEDRVIVAEDGYFYEPVVEQAEGSWIKFDGRWFLNFASYSYLGLIGHNYIDEQAQRAIARHGTGAHGVRLLAGTLHLHRELELALARFLGTEDAIVFSSGYIANVATVGALVGPGDVIIGDVYNHASILDGYRLSGAKVITYAHNDLQDLERALRKVGDAGRLVVTDAVFSMDGDVADLPGIVDLCERYDAPLMVDEAHSLGVLGSTGRGITEHFGIDPARVPVKMGTLSKTVPSAGGYVAGSSDLVFALKNNARGWMFSAAATPAQVAAAHAAVEVIDSVPRLVGDLRAKTDRYRGALRALGFNTLASETPVVPLICADAEQAVAMARLCQRDGLFVQPIVYPAVPRTLPRLRTIVNLSHSDDDLDAALATLEKAGRQVGLIH